MRIWTKSETARVAILHRSHDGGSKELGCSSVLGNVSMSGGLEWECYTRQGDSPTLHAAMQSLRDSWPDKVQNALSDAEVPQHGDPHFDSRDDGRTSD